MYRRPSIISDISSVRRLHSCGEESMSSTSSSDDNHHDGSGSWEGGNVHDIATVTTAPHHRPLTPTELTQLQSLIKSTLHLSNSPCAIQAEEDATDLTKYACDLIMDKMTVLDVLESLEFMELEICGPRSLAEMEKRLVKFLAGLEDAAGSAKKMSTEMRSQSMPVSQGADSSSGPTSSAPRPVRRNSLQSQLMESENHVIVDLSAKTAAVKKREEMKFMFRRGKSLKDRMAMLNGQFVQNGKVAPNNTATPSSVDVNDGVMDDGLDISMRRNEDLVAIMNDMSLTQQEQTDQMKNVRAKYGLAEMKMKVASAAAAASTASNNKETTKKNSVPRAERELRKGRRSSIDLSAKSAAVKKAQELACLKTASTSLKDRMSMYESSVKKPETKSKGVKLLHAESSEQDKLRREELLAVMKDRSLNKEAKARKMEEIRQKYKPAAADEEESDPAKDHQEEEALPEPQGSVMMKESLEKQRRQELQSIMRDRKLGREERRQKMEMARWKYSSSSATVDTTSTASSQDSSSTNMTSDKAKVDLSAKSYAERRRASLESLENSISSNESEQQGGRKHHVMNLRERMSMYEGEMNANNEYIIKA